MSRPKIESIVVITDCTDIAFNEMHQSLYWGLKENGLEDVDIAPKVSVKNFSVENAAFSIRLMADSVVHSKTLFLVVVHGVKTSPERIFGKTKTGLMFVGNNSGYFDWLFDDFGLDSLFVNNINRNINKRSFGGKHVQVPTALGLLKGTPFGDLGEEVDHSFLNREFSIQDGTVVHTDNFGLVKVKAPKLESLNEGDELRLSLNGSYKLTVRYTEKMKRNSDGEWVLFTGSSLYGLPEIAKVRSQDTASELGCKVGDRVSWDR